MLLICRNMSQYQKFQASSNDGTPDYGESVMQGYRRLQIRGSFFDKPVGKGEGLRLGILQMEAAYGPGAKEINLRYLEEAVARAADYNVQLLAFPELYLSGYTLSPEQAREVSEPADGPSIGKCCQIARDAGIALLVPYGEKLVDPDTGQPRYFDSIAVINEQGVLLDSYRKTHLYAQQEHDNWSEGESDFPVHTIHGFPVGVLNCYECEFPELVRILALKGAKLVVGPTAADGYYQLTNGQRSKVPYPDVSQILFPGHAYANNIFFAYANRCGYEERDGSVWHYRGNSIVYGPHGDLLAAAHHEQNTLLISDCVPSYYGDTHPEPEYSYLKDRRPELYGRLVSQ